MDKQITVQTLDKKWGECIRVQCRGLDWWLGGEGTDPHHVIHKTQGYSIRWEITNGILLTREHHNWVHSHMSKEFLAWFIRQNREEYERLRVLSYSSNKIDLEEVNLRLEDYLEHNS